MKNFAFQLYSARNTPLQEALPIIAAAGYTEVEGYGENLKDPDAFKVALDKHRLKAVSLHIGRNELKHSMRETLDVARMLDVNHIVCPYLLPEDRPEDKAGWVELAAEFAEINAQISSVGRDFAWHNHDFEFVRLADGSMPIRALLDEAPEMHWEIDVGWIARVGQDPASWLRTYKDRISAVHVKDVAPDGESKDEDGWADVGHGTIDWTGIVSELQQSDCEFFIAEHDNPADLKRFAERSFTTMASWL